MDRSNTDAMHWAEEFCKTKAKNGWSIDDIDEGLMVSWFANYRFAVADEMEAKLERLTALIKKHNADCSCPCKSSTSETSHFDWHGYDGDCPEDYKIELEGEQDGN